MMRGLVTSVFVAAVIAGSVAGASAQSRPAKDVLLNGTVKGVIGLPDAEGTVGVHMTLETEAGMVTVHLGPAMFIGMSNFSFLVEDVVEIVGVKTSGEGPTYVALSIKEGDRTLTLRDGTGAPVWETGVNGVDGCGVLHAVANVGS
jgi:hypothetical protein